ncbi:MAG: HAMP domain-containing histidine kinase [Candidatus Thorarchaeota archaeon]|nr:HAMP domain-containing histidine kinase [Candidatus Thorarchaeota archaeon]
MTIEIALQLLFPLITFSLAFVVVILAVIRYLVIIRDVFTDWLLGWLTVIVFAAPAIVVVSFDFNLIYIPGALGMVIGFTIILNGVRTNGLNRLPLKYYFIIFAVVVVYSTISYLAHFSAVLYLVPTQYYSGIVAILSIRYLFKNQKATPTVRAILAVDLGGWAVFSFLFPFLLLLFPSYVEIVISIQALILIKFGSVLFGYILRRYDHELRSQYKLTSLMGSIVRHDIRNYLQVAMQGIDLARSDPENIETWLTTVDESLQRATAFVNDMRNLTVEMTRAEKQLTAIHLTDVIDDVLHVSHRSRTLEGFQMRVSVSDDIFVYSHRLVRQIIVNIVDNAIKHGASSLEIHADASNNHVDFVIEDNAGGISSDILEFFNASESISLSSAPGYGLGIIIIRALAPICNVQLHVELTEDGTGTRWIMRFERIASHMEVPSSHS